jgi:hypothetical protein
MKKNTTKLVAVLNTEDPSAVQVKASDQQAIQELISDLANTTDALTNVTLQICDLEQRQQQLAQRLGAMKVGYVEHVRKTALAYGLDLDHQSWDFYPHKMSFSKKS